MALSQEMMQDICIVLRVTLFLLLWLWLNTTVARMKVLDLKLSLDDTFLTLRDCENRWLYLFVAMSVSDILFALDCRDAMRRGCLALVAAFLIDSVLDNRCASIVYFEHRLLLW